MRIFYSKDEKTKRKKYDIIRHVEKMIERGDHEQQKIRKRQIAAEGVQEHALTNQSVGGESCCCSALYCSSHNTDTFSVLLE